MSNLTTGLFFALTMGLAFGKFRMPVDTPVDRLLENIQSYIKTNPQNAQGHYTLARLHYLAFALRTDTVGSLGGDPPLLGDRFHTGKPGGKKGKLSEAEALRHLTAAVAEIQIAQRLDPSNPLFELTAGCIWEDGAPFASRVRPGDFEPNWIARAVSEYKRAHLLGWKDESGLDKQPLAGLGSLVSYEAGQSFVRLARDLSSEKAAVGETEKHLKVLHGLPMTGITPIVLSLKAGSFEDLLAPGMKTSFDLDGTGRAQSYPWVAADTGLLVWDPDHTGIITSGRQLFGTVTWWMFWNNGYDAMAALDNNHDGWLTGAELDGLAVWFDRNQNGRSDPGEVIPVDELGITALSVWADGAREGAAWKSSKGVRLKSGEYLPTWDWVVTLGRQ